MVVAAFLALLIGYFVNLQKKKIVVQPLPEPWRETLQKDVPFYAKLDKASKDSFEFRMMHFLATTRITGINTSVEDLDKVYIASSAIIPIFAFSGWSYDNLNEVLLYPDSFNHDFELSGDKRNILGMVGDGALNRVMILSQHELRQAFLNKTSKSNTAIHEFVHLLDKSDGAVDGMPEFFADKQYILPWLQLIQLTMQKMASGKSDINPYALSSSGEFFAVVSEYFFERPDLLKFKHPELYNLLAKIFKNQKI